MLPISFIPFQSHISAEFWQALGQDKIDNAKLEEKDIPIAANYSEAAKLEQERDHIRIDLGHDAFQTDRTPSGSQCTARGIVRNTNTFEEFKTLDKNQFLTEVAGRLWEDITSGAALEEPTLLVPMALLCFADLKKYIYTYWATYPVLKLTWTCTDVDIMEESVNNDLRSAVKVWRARTESTQWGFFVYDRVQKTSHRLSEWKDVPDASRSFCFTDPSSSAEALGWPARNLMFLLACSARLESFNLISYRGQMPSVQYLNCRSDATTFSSMPKALGWERNGVGKLGPLVANLSTVMDPIKLADDAVDLNLKLMKWRVAPDIDLVKIKDCKCLLLGAGTLGCYISRLLLGWGVKNVTFADSGRVSFSNPVRQPLFKFSDCLNEGSPKAETAAAALREIYPSINAAGYRLTVPMIGHPFLSHEQGRSEFEQLEALIESHDAIFLLMDSREARWLPTVIGAAKGKLVINAALGFDSYVVTRHGVPGTTTDQRLGCYFCNDVVAPADSTSDRTLDQQCTVTRPGLAALAAATAVELLVSILQHPLGPACPAPEAPSTASTSTAPAETVLGSVPHTIRGSLRSWETRVLRGEAYLHCSACSDAVLAAYRDGTDGGWAFCRRACDEAGWVEALSGLKAVQDGIEGIDVDWDDDDDHDDDDEEEDDIDDDDHDDDNAPQHGGEKEGRETGVDGGDGTA